MSYKKEAEVTPRNGHTFRTLVIARISGCQRQKEMSLEDQTDHGKEVSAEIYNGPTEFVVVATKAKGERLDRPELDEIEAALRTGRFDLMVMEDVGRLVRGADAVRLWGIAVDNGTRCVAPNDCCDTNDETWEEDLLEACADHVGHNNKVSKRCKRKMMNRFVKYGHTAARPIAGFLVPQGARSYDDWRINEADAPVIREAAMVLRQHLNCSALADWFKSRGLRPGPCCKSETWTGAMVRRYFANPLLKGMPQRGRYHSVKHHERGRRVSVKNPAGPCFYSAPHLAILQAEEFDDLNEALTARNGKLGRRTHDGTRPYSPRRSKFPSGTARCWYCGFPFVWGAHGQVQNLQCTCSREWSCWNSVGLDGAMLTQKIVEVIIRELEELEEFHDQFAAMVAEAQSHQFQDGDQQRQRLDVEAGKLKAERANLERSILEIGPRPMLNRLISELEERERRLLQQRARLERFEQPALQLPETPADLMQLFQSQIEGLAQESYEFSDVLRTMVKSCHVFVVQLIDGGNLEPRTKVSLNLGGVASALEAAPVVTQLLTRELTIDVFVPPQRERIREEAVRLSVEHPEWTQRQIAAAIDEKPEQTAVWRALELHGQMLERGLTSPYVLVTEPPADYHKLRRHKHPRYEFRPLEGYERPPLDEQIL